jgi:hypothetical protein
LATLVTPRKYRFTPFELDCRSGELSCDGKTTRLQEQPFQALLMLLEHAGEVVTRDELRRRVWPGETFVDFDHALNSIFNRLREVCSGLQSIRCLTAYVATRGSRAFSASCGCSHVERFISAEVAWLEADADDASPVRRHTRT